MKNILFTALAGMMLTTAVAQTGTPVELAPFNSIHIQNTAKVFLSTGSPQHVTVNDSTGKVKISSSGGQLKISGGAARVYVTIPELTSVDISGSGSLTSDSIIRTPNLRVDISGTGKVTMPVQVNKLQAGISGLGKLDVSGSADQVEINISGNGKVNGIGLTASTVDANISGVGKCYVDVKDALDLNISGTGTFYYVTEPAKLSTRISGIGKYGAYNATDMGRDSTSFVIGKSRITISADDVDEDDDDDDNDYDGHSGARNIADSLAKPEKSKSHWTGIDIGFNSLFTGSDFGSNLPSGLDYLELNPGKSINVNVNLFAHDFKLYKRYVMFTTGIGLTLNNYRFTSDTLTLKSTNPLTATTDFDNKNELIRYEKNKLAVNYVTVPLLLQFNTSEEYKKSFHIAAGALLSYKYNSHLKLVYKSDGDREKTKRQGEYDIDPFRADLTLRAGYRNWTVYASYAMTSLFKENRGPDLHPFQVGINLFGW